MQAMKLKVEQKRGTIQESSQIGSGPTENRPLAVSFYGAL